MGCGGRGEYVAQGPCPFTGGRPARHKACPEAALRRPSPSRVCHRVPMTTITHFESGARMSQAVACGDMVYLAGQVAGTVVGAGVTAQTQEILAEIDRLLALAGSDKTRLLTATIYLADMATFAEMNAAWDAWVSKENPPTRATVEARLAGPEYLVEIVVTAVKLPA